MVVGCEGFEKSSLPHDYEARAVNKAPFLVEAFGKQPPRLCVEGGIHMDDMNVRRCFQAIDKRDDLRSSDPERVDQKRREFHEYVVRGDERIASLPNITINIRRAVVMFLAGIHKMAPSGGVGENVRHRGRVRDNRRGDPPTRRPRRQPPR